MADSRTEMTKTDNDQVLKYKMTACVLSLIVSAAQGKAVLHLTVTCTAATLTCLLVAAELGLRDPTSLTRARDFWSRIDPLHAEHSPPSAGFRIQRSL